MTQSDALAAEVRLRAEKLQQLFTRIVSCHVVFELAGHHHRHGDRYHVSINLGLPGNEIVVNHEPSPDSPAETAQMAIHQAFDEAERLLEGRLGRQRAHRQDKASNE
jgi:ribosome-associated translation inhibitor RaiA